MHFILLRKYNNYIETYFIIYSINQVKYYNLDSKKLKINKNKYYKDFLKQCDLISDAFNQYFNFEKTIEEMLGIINNSLNIVLGESAEKFIYLEENDYQEQFNYNQIIAILSTNYLSLICRVIGIIYHYQNRINVFNNNKKTNNIKLNMFIQSLSFNIEEEITKKILYFFFWFAFGSRDNSFLILSHYFFNELIKVSIKYCHIVFKLFYICIKNVLIFNINDNNETNNKGNRTNIIIE